jgi:hypothetical protein
MPMMHSSKRRKGGIPSPREALSLGNVQNAAAENGGKPPSQESGALPRGLSRPKAPAAGPGFASPAKNAAGVSAETRLPDNRFGPPLDALLQRPGRIPVISPNLG